jgi:hypothetical protein
MIVGRERERERDRRERERQRERERERERKVTKRQREIKGCCCQSYWFSPLAVVTPIITDFCRFMGRFIDRTLQNVKQV